MLSTLNSFIVRAENHSDVLGVDECNNTRSARTRRYHITRSGVWSFIPSKKWQQYTLFSLFVVGLVYMILPGPSSINDFPSLPDSVKSNLEGDTIQNPNISAYFSDFNRAGITAYYLNFFSRSLFLGIPLPVIKLNHPPEMAYKYVRDQQESTFLEEYIFPLRESIFVNGYEPYVENEMYHKQHSEVGDHIVYQAGSDHTGGAGRQFDSKTTLRFYPSNIFIRIFVYLSIWILSFSLWKVFRQAWSVKL